MSEESKTIETTDEDKLLAMAKDLVELAIQSQKVLAASSISYSAIEEARLLATMTNAVIDQYTSTNVETSLEGSVEDEA